MPPDDPSASKTRSPGLSLQSRRGFLLTALAAGLSLTGCAQTRTSTLPGPEWPDDGDPWLAREPRRVPAVPAPTRGAGDFMSRSAWTNAPPRPSRMTAMLPIRYVTVHHSAGPIFQATDRYTTAERLEAIRRYHCDERGWGDIGYHYAVDRAGRVWECRPLQWQGDHVKNHNEHNIGVMLLGDFDRQQPTNAQLAGLTAHVSSLVGSYRVSPSRLMTHQEWAPTACPGSSLQRYMVGARASGRFG